MKKGENASEKDLLKFYDEALGEERRNFIVKTNKPYDKGCDLICKRRGVVIIEAESNYQHVQIVSAPNFDLWEVIKGATDSRGPINIVPNNPRRLTDMTKKRLRQINDCLKTIREIWTPEELKLTFGPKTGKMEADFLKNKKRRTSKKK